MLYLVAFTSFQCTRELFALQHLGESLTSEFMRNEWFLAVFVDQSAKFRSGQVRSANSSGEGQKETWLLEKEIKEMRRGRGMT